MTTTVKIVLVVIVGAVVGGLVWWYFAMNPGSNLSALTASTTPTQTSAPLSESQIQSMPVDQGGGNTTVSASNTSDAALSQDLANIDAQMGGLQSDESNAKAAQNTQ